MNKYKFMEWAFALTAIASAIVFIIVGIKAPIEPGMSVFGHWLKVFFMWCFVTVILETFMYTIGQIAWFWREDYKDKYGKGWFWKGIRDDIHYLKTEVNWKKVLITFIVFFGIAFAIIGLLELIVP